MCCRTAKSCTFDTAQRKREQIWPIAMHKPFLRSPLSEIKSCKTWFKSQIMFLSLANKRKWALHVAKSKWTGKTNTSAVCPFVSCLWIFSGSLSRGRSPSEKSGLHKKATGERCLMCEKCRSTGENLSQSCCAHSADIYMGHFSARSAYKRTRSRCIFFYKNCWFCWKSATSVAW